MVQTPVTSSCESARCAMAPTVGAMTGEPAGHALYASDPSLLHTWSSPRTWPASWVTTAARSVPLHVVVLPRLLTHGGSVGAAQVKSPPTPADTVFPSQANSSMSASKISPVSESNVVVVR